MNMIKKNILLSSVSLFVFTWMACDPGQETTSSGDPSTCEGCHTNKDLLKELIAESSAKISPKTFGAT